MDAEILEKVGLSKNESKVYLALVRLGSASVTQISKKADVHRVNIYDTLERLQERGLVASVMKSNKKYFEAASPTIVKKMLEEREKELEKIKKDFPSLLLAYKESGKRQEVHSFKGLLGIKTVLKGILDERPKEILNFASTNGFFKFSPVAFGIWEAQRVRAKIFMKGIMSKKMRNKLPTKSLQKFKFLEEQFNNVSSTMIYNDKVAIFMWTEDPIAILIESKELAKSYKNYFHSMWKQAKR